MGTEYSLRIGSWKFAKAAVGTSVVTTAILFLAAQLRSVNIPIDDGMAIVVGTSVVNGLARFVFNWAKVKGYLEI